MGSWRRASAFDGLLTRGHVCMWVRVGRNFRERRMEMDICRQLYTGVVIDHQYIHGYHAFLCFACAYLVACRPGLVCACSFKRLERRTRTCLI